VFVLKTPAVKQAGLAQLYVVNADGTNLKLLLDGYEATSALFSPDGMRLLYLTNSYTDGGPYNYSTNLINIDGTGQKRIPAAGGDMAWSPAGDQVAFVCPHSNTYTTIRRICVADRNGENAVTLTAESVRAVGPKWSPDGRSIAYTCDTAICVIAPDGTGLKVLTPGTVNNSAPVWSPDSRRILYNCGSRLCIINQDGTGDRTLVSLPTMNSSGSWSPLSN
jgi:Tol biopolymer transport system component